jgi:competence protein ComEA
VPLSDRAVDRVRALLPAAPPAEGGWVPRQLFAPPDELPEDEPETVAEVLGTARWDPARNGVLALVVVAVVAALVAGVVLLRGKPSEQSLTVPSVVGASTAASGGPEVVVDVAGRVRHPGLVRLPAGARVDDALRAAGGVLPGTSTTSLNRAAKVQDGQQVVVGEQVASGPAGTTAGGLLDLNAATAQDFDALPGIGPVLADRIVSWRTEHGRFGSVDQLREVSGIGESKYQSLKAKVRV